MGASQEQLPTRTLHGAYHSIFLVEDHPIVRAGLRQLIAGEKDLKVCAEAHTAKLAKAMLREHVPDVLVVDLTLEQGDGLEVIRDARARYPDMKILVLSMHDELLYAERLLSAGANGYLMKSAASDSFVPAIRQLLQGRNFVSQAVSSQIIENFANPKPDEKPSNSPTKVLTDRELQILNMLGKGLSTSEASKELNLSIKTVESHRQRIKRKLNLKTTAQLIQFAVNWVDGRQTS